MSRSTGHYEAEGRDEGKTGHVSGLEQGEGARGEGRGAMLQVSQMQASSSGAWAASASPGQITSLCRLHREPVGPGRGTLAAGA